MSEEQEVEQYLKLLKEALTGLTLVLSKKQQQQITHHQCPDEAFCFECEKRKLKGVL